MKKKQLFAVLLAGSMTVGMAPAAAFAAEDTGAAANAAAGAIPTVMEPACRTAKSCFFFIYKSSCSS